VPRQKTITVASQLPGSEFGTVVQQPVITADSVNSRQPNLWCFCKLCGRQTEYAVALESVTIFERLKNGAAKAVEITPAMRDEAQRIADSQVEAFQQTLLGATGSPSLQALLGLCNIREMEGKFLCVETFRDQVERRALLIEWAKHGDIAGATRLPGIYKGAQRPSKLYCDLHYPGRSADARRAYQRDRRFAAEYAEIIGEIWAQYAGYIRAWNLDDHALVRHAAYHHLRLMKAPTRILDGYCALPIATNGSPKSSSRTKSIADYYEVARAAHERIWRMKEPMHWVDELTKHGISNQSEIARRLGINRQAVSAAFKRKSTRIEENL
jgi:hypothetical protein